MKPQDKPFRPAVVLTRLILLWWLASASLPLRAQTWDEVTRNRHDEYLYGEGTGTTFDEADRMALARLISQISVAVSASTRQRAQQVTTAGAPARYEAITEDDIQTYSEATLTNTHSVTLAHSDSEWSVGRWIRRSELDTIFHTRRAKVRDFMAMARRAEESGRADDALRYYYWGLLLLETLPQPSSVTLEADGQRHVLTAWIPERINGVLRDLRTEVLSRDGKDIVLRFTYRGRPVSSLDYKYFDGHVESRICTARDGLGPLELYPGYEPKQLEITYEVTYANEAHLDHEVAAVMRARDKAHAADARWRNLMNGWMRLAKVKVDPQPVGASRGEAAASAAPSAAATLPVLSALDHDKARSCHDRMERILGSIRSGAYTEADTCFTPEGLDVYRRLIAYGQARILGEPDLRYYAYGDGIICRGMQMAFSPKNNLRKSFVEDIAVAFNADGLATNISFGLGQKAEADIMGRSAWPEAVRQAIMFFLENYKTAFALKRLDYIKTIFDDNAVIITGTILRHASGGLDEHGISQMGRETLRRNRFNKAEYIRHLQRCFMTNEFINIRFSDNEIRRSEDDVYGIQIAQDYYSTHYGDHGYLFLMVDMRQPDEPLIKVRTWQPERDPKFGIYNVGDF